MRAASQRTEEELCQEIVRVCQLMYDKGFIWASDGNVSARLSRNRILITPSGLHKGFLRPDQILLVNERGERLSATTAANRHLKPTSELPMHLEAYRRRPDIGAVVHAHPPITIALSIAGISMAHCLLPETIVFLGTGIMDEKDVTRAKILGVLIQDARRHTGRAAEDCAAMLNISPEQFAEVEAGARVLSLPDLEALAIFLKVPMAHFWGGKVLHEQSPRDYSQIILLRQRIVGALLRQARIESGRSVDDVAQHLAVAPELVQRYEMGEEPIPYFQLESAARYLGQTIDHFSDSQGPLVRHEAEQRVYRRFEQMPLEMKTFVTEPINQSYIETAMRLSEMDVHKLRSIAEGLLDITF
jgi:transcriptional regulator with XRE-family HTH domain